MNGKGWFGQSRLRGCRILPPKHSLDILFAYDKRHNPRAESRQPIIFRHASVCCSAYSLLEIQQHNSHVTIVLGGENARGGVIEEPRNSLYVKLGFMNQRHGNNQRGVHPFRVYTTRPIGLILDVL